MKAVDVSEVRTSTRETWLSTPLSDPNAALWASITPPAHPTVGMAFRRHARALSFDMLAHRLYRRFPQTFASRASARLGILGAVLALASAAAGVSYLALEPEGFLETERVHAAPDLQPASVAPSSTSFVRLGQTAIDPLPPNRAPTLSASTAPALTEQVTLPLSPRTAIADADVSKAGKAATAKRISAKKQFKATPRRAKPRRAPPAAE